MHDFEAFNTAMARFLAGLSQDAFATVDTQVAWDDEIVPVRISSFPLGANKREIQCELPSHLPEDLVYALWDHIDDNLPSAEDTGTRDGDNGTTIIVFDLTLTNAA